MLYGVVRNRILSYKSATNLPLLLAVLLFSLTAKAQLIHLARVDSEPENHKIHNFFIDIDDNNHLVALMQESNGSVQFYPFEQINNKYVVVAREQNYDAVSIRCTNCNIETGGIVTLKYLSTGFPESYREKNIRLTPENGWALRTSNFTIKQIDILGRYFLGRIIGIKDIIFKP